MGQMLLMSAQAGGGGGLLDLLLPMILVFGVFYFLVIRPQSKQRREREQMLTQLKAGDEVITTGGILGKIKSIRDNIVTLEVSDRVKLRVLQNQIAGLEKQVIAAEPGNKEQGSTDEKA